MIAGDFANLVSLCGRLDHAGAKQDFMRGMNRLYTKLCSAPSAAALLLYQEIHRRARTKDPDARIPSFYDGDFLERSFEADPSDYAVVFGLAMKNLHHGNQTRAVQLLTRIANSQCKGNRLAVQQLKEIENSLHASPNG